MEKELVKVWFHLGMDSEQGIQTTKAVAPCSVPPVDEYSYGEEYSPKM